MELTDFTEGFGLSSINFGNIIDKIYFYAGIFLLVVIVGGIAGVIYFTWRRRAMGVNSEKVNWWEEVGEGAQRTGVEEFEELVIPGTLLRVFYNKKRDLWLPKFTRPSAKKTYEVMKTKTGQIVNFEVRGISSDPKYAKITIDNTDMLWAAENLREFIKRNYEDKAKKWWEVYADKIAMAALIFVFTFCFIIIIYFVKGMVNDIGSISNQITQNAEVCRLAATSGINTVA